MNEYANKTLSSSKRKCRNCCRRCNMGGLSYNQTNLIDGEAFPVDGGKHTIVILDETFEDYQERTKACTIKKHHKIPPKKQCKMRLEVSHKTKEIAICKDCILDGEIKHHVCKDQIVLPVPVPPPEVKPPHPENWHQICTCTWVKNGKHYHGPEGAIHLYNQKSLEEMEKSKEEYKKKVAAYRDQMRHYTEKMKQYRHDKAEHAKNLKAAKELEEKYRHEVKTYNEIHAEHGKRHPLRMLCPCNAPQARALAIDEVHVPAIREIAANLMGDEASHLLQHSIRSTLDTSAMFESFEEAE